MPWVQVAEFQLSQTWQYTAPVAGRLFRVRHLQIATEGSALLSQAFLDEGTLQLFGTQRLRAKAQYDLFDFVLLSGLENQRCIAAKLSTFTEVGWTIAIDLLEPENAQEQETLLATLQALIDTKEDVNVAADLLQSHLDDLNPHGQYATTAGLTAAIAPLSEAIDTKADAAALESKVDTTVFQAALVQVDEAIDTNRGAVRQSVKVQFTGTFSTNSQQWVSLAVSAQMPNPLASAQSRVRVRFEGYGGLGSSSFSALFSIARGTTLLHPSGTDALARLIASHPSHTIPLSFEVEDVPGIVEPQTYTLKAKVSGSTSVYIGRPGNAATPVLPCFLTLEEIV
jgi:hypothetical protein